MRIDADAHVIESERTWDYMVGADAQYKPYVVVPEQSGFFPSFWAIDGRLFGRGANDGPDVARESREVADVSVRIRHMDELGVDIQVLYPSVFLSPLTDRPEVEAALCRSYNRWV